MAPSGAACPQLSKENPKASDRFRLSGPLSLSGVVGSPSYTDQGHLLVLLQLKYGCSSYHHRLQALYHEDARRQRMRVVHTCMHTYSIHAYIHTYIHTCMHAYIHTYIHTYIHAQRMNNGLSTGLGTLGVGTRAMRTKMRLSSTLSRSPGIGMGTNPYGRR